MISAETHLPSGQERDSSHSPQLVVLPEVDSFLVHPPIVPICDLDEEEVGVQSYLFHI